MIRDYKLYLADIGESILLIEKYLEEASEEKFLIEKGLQDQVIRRLEIIGEAISKIPRALKEKNPSTIWEEFSEFRNFIVHHYYDASLRRIWKIIKGRLPILKDHIKNIKLV